MAAGRGQPSLNLTEGWLPRRAPIPPCIRSTITPPLQVDFDLELDLGPYMSERPRQPVLYDLYAVLVHSGHSVHSGHYYAYVRAPNGIWHICDDTHVAQVRRGSLLS